jgi:hypothetical protein
MSGSGPKAPGPMAAISGWFGAARGTFPNSTPALAVTTPTRTTATTASGFVAPGHSFYTIRRCISRVFDSLGVVSIFLNRENVTVVERIALGFQYRATTV